MIRREFLKAAGFGAAAVSVGCDRIRGKVASWLGGGVPDSFEVAAGKLVDDRVHLLNRAAFGPWPGDLETVTKLGTNGWIEQQLNHEGIDDLACSIRCRGFETIDLPAGECYEYKRQYLEKELARHTLMRAVYSKRQLFEVMVEFWSDHFNINLGKSDCAWLKTADDRETIRPHALGKFRELVRASALSPAMLVYLDGRENKKSAPGDKPNENYARELLELHTLGVHGGYTQKDVMEVARCLTGWTVQGQHQWMKGKVEFHPDRHDDGSKFVLGCRIPEGGGAGDLDTVLNIVCFHPSTAKFVAEKLCRRFVSDNPPASLVEATAKAFLDSGGDVKTIVRTVLTSQEFRDSKGQKLKRPFRYVVSALRALGAETPVSPDLMKYLGFMGQPLFQHPTPDGYPDETMPWLGTLLWRWNFALALATNSVGNTRVDIEGLAKSMGADGDPTPRFLRHLLGREPVGLELDAVNEFLTSGSRREAVGLVLASPAFQRC